MPKIREQVFLGCKTNIRDAEGSWAECNRSLERLNTQAFDLYQLHSVGKLEALDECTRKGGALETLIKANEQGLTTWLGITGHTHDAPSTHLEALRRFDFDTALETHQHESDLPSREAERGPGDRRSCPEGSRSS
jgi:predicted aldo/keto reductase-like oxidoreductase